MQTVTNTYKIPKSGGRTAAAQQDTAGDTWYATQGGQWRNTRTNAVSKTVPNMIPTATAKPMPMPGGDLNTIPGGPETPAAPATPPPAAAAPAEPTYFDYTVPGHGNKTKGIKDTAGDTWYQTQGGQWRNVKTQAVQKDLPAWQQPVVAAPPPAVATPAPAPAAAPAPEQPEVFKSVRDFAPVGTDPYTPAVNYGDYPKELGVPAAYDSSLMDLRLGKGLDAIRAKLSADGLIGSGAEGQLMNDYAAQVTAEEAQRRQDMEEAARGRLATAWGTSANAAESAKNRSASAASGDQGQFYTNTQNESARRTAQGNTQWSRVMDVLDRILSQSPASNGFDAAKTSSGDIQAYGDKLAQLLGAAAGGGGGGSSGGGGSGTVPVKPANYSSGALDYSNANDWSSLIGNLIPVISNIYK